jgi:hypothetical protein
MSSSRRLLADGTPKLQRGRPPKSELPYIVDPLTDCWVWQRGKSHRGYGLMWNGTKKVTAHSAMFEKHHGPVPDGMQLDHKCRRRDCCNPWHLEIVTPQENTRRGLSTKLTDADVQAIKDAAAIGTPFKRLAEQFGVSDTQIRRVVRGQRSGRVRRAA